MPWFFVEGVENGAVFNYQIKNNLVEIRHPEDLAELRKEPGKFRELSKREVVAFKRAATSSVTPEKPVIPIESSKVEETVTEDIKKPIEELVKEPVEEPVKKEVPKKKEVKILVEEEKSKKKLTSKKLRKKSKKKSKK